MNSRKKCIACGLVTFASDEVYKRCGSDKLFAYAMPEGSSADAHRPAKKLSFGNYLVCFIIACLLEFLTVWYFLANLKFSFSPHGEPASERKLEAAMILFHLPALIFIASAERLAGIVPVGFLLILMVAFQLASWTFIFAGIWKFLKVLNDKPK